MSDFGLQPRYSQPQTPAPRTVGTVTVRLQLPASVRAGTVLRYTVTLRNSTDTKITLHPRPGYSEDLYNTGLAVRRSFALNCDSVVAIPAHQSVCYAMRLTMPSRAAPGMAKFGWGLNTPAGLFVGSAIIVK